MPKSEKNPVADRPATGKKTPGRGGRSRGYGLKLFEEKLLFGVRTRTLTDVFDEVGVRYQPISDSDVVVVLEKEFTTEDGEDVDVRKVFEELDLAFDDSRVCFFDDTAMKGGKVSVYNVDCDWYSANVVNTPARTFFADYPEEVFLALWEHGVLTGKNAKKILENFGEPAEMFGLVLDEKNVVAFFDSESGFEPLFIGSELSAVYAKTAASTADGFPIVYKLGGGRDLAKGFLVGGRFFHTIWEAGTTFPAMLRSEHTKSFAVSPVGTHIAFGRESEVLVVDSETGEPTTVIPLRGKDVVSMIFSPGGESVFLVTSERLHGGKWSNSLESWDVSSGREVAEVGIGNGHGVLRFSDDGSTVFVDDMEYDATFLFPL